MRRSSIILAVAFVIVPFAWAYLSTSAYYERARQEGGYVCGLQTLAAVVLACFGSSIMSAAAFAIFSAVIFNALIIIALIPLALRGVAYKPIGALAILQRNLLIYGLGGVIIPFIGIKLIDLIITALHLAYRALRNRT